MEAQLFCGLDGVGDGGVEKELCCLQKLWLCCWGRMDRSRAPGTVWPQGTEQEDKDEVSGGEMGTGLWVMEKDKEILCLGAG